MPRRTRASLALVLIGAVAGLCGGCVTEGPPTSRPVRNPPTQPAGTEATDLDLIVSRYAQDSDKNGYADMLHVTVYLFSSTGGYSMAVRQEGSLSFDLVGEEGKPITRWEFTAEEAAAARQPLMAGPGFMFKLSLLDGGGSDAIGATDAQLRCTFTPNKGQPVANRSPVRVAVGRL